MRRQPVLADVDAIGEARLHHPPAQRALQAAQQEQAEKFQPQNAADLAHGDKNNERD